jgi:hypothetical protein
MQRILLIVLSILAIATIYYGIVIPMEGYKFSSKSSLFFKLYFHNQLVQDLPILSPKGSPIYELHSSSSQFAQAWEVQYQSNSDRSALAAKFLEYLRLHNCNFLVASEPGCNWKSIDTSKYDYFEVIKGQTHSQLFELRIRSTKYYSDIDFLVVE